MFVQDKFKALSTPLAFVPSSLNVPDSTSPQSGFAGRYMDTYWVSKRKNGRLAVNHGMLFVTVMSFGNKAWAEALNGFTYNELLEHSTSGRVANFTSGGVRAMIQKASHARWDGTEYWQRGYLPEVSPIIPATEKQHLINFYQNMSVPPYGSDGWYYFKRTPLVEI